MKTLLIAAACILAVNLLYLLGVALAEVLGHRKSRRQVAALEELMYPVSRRRAGFAGRTAVAAAAIALIGGVAVVSPATRDAVVSTVGDVVERFRGGTDVEVAAEDPEAAASAEAPGPGNDLSSDPGDRGSSGGSAREGSGGDPSPDRSSDQVARSGHEGVPPAEGTEGSVSPAPAPFTVDASPGSSSSILVSWEAHPTATEYVVERSADDGNGWVLVTTTAADFRSVPIDGLAAETTYQVQVTARVDGVAVEMARSSATTAPAPSSPPEG